MCAERAYIPAAGHDLFLPFYDFITKVMGADEARRLLFDQSELRPEHRVLDLGCGTGTLAIELKRQYADVEVVALDPDPKALARARRKAQREKVLIEFDQGFSDALEYPSSSFDRVFSSFMFHHLQASEREKTLREVRRVLKPQGLLLLLDFDMPESSKHRVLSQLFHSHAQLKDTSSRQILALINQAGFTEAKKVADRAILFKLAHIAYYRACAGGSW